MKLGVILVPLDGSALAEMALPTATELAEVSGAGVLLVRAAEAYTPLGIDPIEARARAMREADEYLRQAAERLRTAGVKDVKVSAWYGPPASAIVEAARLGKADLIVMTTHGRSGLALLIFGSVAESVLRGTRTPILLIRPSKAPVDTPVTPGAAVPLSETGSRA